MSDSSVRVPYTGQNLDGSEVDCDIITRNGVNYYRQRVINTSYELEIARGRVPGAEPVSGYGRKTTVGADSGLLWPNGVYSYPPSVGAQLSIVSTSANDSAAGTGIRTLEIHCLLADLTEYVELVALNGLTPVLTVATNIRFVQCMHMVTFGTLNSADGNISATSAAGNHSYISSGNVRCTSSLRMVPAGKRMVINTLFAGSVSGSAAAAAVINAATPTFPGHDFTSSGVLVPLASSAFQDGSAGISIVCPMSFTAGQSFGFTFSVDKAATVVGQWFGYIEPV